MADPNNVPQEAQQLTEDLESKDKETSETASSDVAKTNFDEDYEEAKQNSGGSGSQSSDSNPVSRKGGAQGTAGSSSSTGGGMSKDAEKIDDIDSPGDSDPDDYRNMAKDTAKGKADK